MRGNVDVTVSVLVLVKLHFTALVFWKIV